LNKELTTKKNPLLSSTSNDISDIEKAVDKILSENKQRTCPPPQHPSDAIDVERPDFQNISPRQRKKSSVFFVKKKKQSEPPVDETSKIIDEKAEQIKNKKKMGFGKKKDSEPPVPTQQKTPEIKPAPQPDAQPSLEKPLPKEEHLPQFDESYSQIKPDEASWLDKQIQEKEDSTVTPHNGGVVEENQKPTLPQQDTTITPVPAHKKLKKGNPPKEHRGLFGSKKKESTPSQPLATSPLSSKGVAPSLPADSPQPPVVIPSLGSSKKTILDEITPDGIIQYVNEARQLKSITLQKLGYKEEALEEIDFYPLHEPFAYVEIIREKESLDKRYVLVEVDLTEKEATLLQFLKESLGGFTIDTAELEVKGEKKYLNEQVDRILLEYKQSIEEQSKKKILYFLEKQFLGLGKLEVLMRDPQIEDISCDGSGVPLFLYHRRYGSLKSNVQFDEEEQLTAFVVKLAQKCGKHISIAEPMLDATMPDGSRIQMTLSTEVTTKGSTFTIRKFSEDPFSPPDLIEFNTMSSEMVAYMWLAVENGVNALIAGGTAAGKTSTLNALSLFIPRESKIVSIEETREINLPHPNWIPGVARSGFGEVVGNKVVGEIDMYDLMKAALRQRPEYIIVGEIRGKEAYVLFQAMATGHTTYSTVHADSAPSLIHRLEGKPIEIPRIMLQALDIVCIQVISRVKNKRARRCKQIIEIIDIDPTTKEILTNEVFRWDPIGDKFMYSGKSYILERIRTEKDIDREGMINEIRQRALLLEWMNKTNIRDFKKVATVVAQYVDNPTDVMKKVKNEL